MREKIDNLPSLYFSECGDCVDCCSGKFFLAPLILEDFDKVKNYFEIRAVILEDIIPVMLLANGINSCEYLNSNGKCDIYANRPPVCKIYPFSPYYNDIFIDLECKAIGIKGEKLPSNKDEFFKSDYFENRLDNFLNKREKTLKFMKKQTLIFDKEIKGIKLYKF